MKKIKENIYSWELKDIIMMAIISIFFAIIYLGAVYLASAFGAFLAPFGLSVFANEVIFGVWFMAATLAGFIIQKPGVSIVSEMLAAFLEVLMGNFYGPIVFVSGFLQGLGAELGFAFYKYKKFDLKSLCLSATGATITSFIWGFFRSGFFDLNISLLIIMFIVRLSSALFFSGFLVYQIGNKLAKTGLLTSYPLGKEVSEA